MLMYGSSFRMLTGTPRALRMRPMLAAVMPFPSELVTPPVTKTYLGIGPVLRVRLGVAEARHASRDAVDLLGTKSYSRCSPAAWLHASWRALSLPRVRPPRPRHARPRRLLPRWTPHLAAEPVQLPPRGTRGAVRAIRAGPPLR